MTKLVYFEWKKIWHNGTLWLFFAVRPMNFLIKPISEEQVLQVLKQANHLLNKDNAMYEYKINRQSYFIAFKKIQYFEAANRQVIIHWKDGNIR